METKSILCAGKHLITRCALYDENASATGERPLLLRWLEREAPSLEKAQALVEGQVTLLDLPNGEQLLFDEEAAIKTGIRANSDACYYLRDRSVLETTCL